MLVAVLLTLAAASLAAVYVQNAWVVTTQTKQRLTEGLEEPAERYISIFRATIQRIEGNTYRLDASVYNGGQWDYNYTHASFVISDGSGFTLVETNLSTTCPDVIPAGQICTFSKEFNYQGDPNNLSVVVRIDRVELYVRPLVLPPPEVPPTYFTCHSCSECNAVVNAGEYGQIVVDLNATATGDCLTILRPGVVVSCASPIVGSGSGTGIRIAASDVTLKNCTVENFETGILFDHATDLTVVNVYLRNNAVHARWLFDRSTCNLGSFENVQTDDGPIYFLQGSSGTSVSDAAAVWLYGTSNVSVSSVSGHVSPVIALCEDVGTSITDVSAPSGVDRALVSLSSSGFSITGFFSLATHGALFDSPDAGTLDTPFEVR